MMLTCLKCGQAWHVSAKVKYKANNYICPKCEMHKKSTDGNGTRAGGIAGSNSEQCKR